MTTRFIQTVLITALSLLSLLSFGQDWPMWRYDAGRTASSPHELPDQLNLQWTLNYTQREMTWDDPLNQDLMNFDKYFEPISVGDVLYVGFNDQDKVLAIDHETGKEIWSFYTDGPVRLPLAYSNKNIYFTSDDGYLYCLSAKTGELNWKFRGGPADRKLLGNKRLISTWPARGGVVIENDIVYFAASIWPSMGTFIYALNAKDGNIIWKNDGTSADYIKQPHSAYSFAGIAPQGIMAVNGDDLFIPGGRSVPGCFDKKTGELKYYYFNDFNKTGGAFVATRGEYFVNHHRDRNTVIYQNNDGQRVSPAMEKYPVLDKEIFYFSGKSVVARDPNKPDEILWSVDVDASGDLIQAGSKLYAAGKNSLAAIQLNGKAQPQITWTKKINAQIGRLIAANNRLFAISLDGRVMAFGERQVDKEMDLFPEMVEKSTNRALQKEIKDLLFQTGVSKGYALYLGVNKPELLETLALNSDLTIIAIDKDKQKVQELRKTFDHKGIKASKVAFLCEQIEDLDLAPYFSSLTVIEDLSSYNPEKLFNTIYNTTRPFGGKIWVQKAGQDKATLKDLVNSGKYWGLSLAGESGEELFLSRNGEPKGSDNWTHLYGSMANTIKSNDDLVKLPLGVLWFGGNSNMDVLPRHGHGPPEQIMNGKLIIEGLKSITARDVYTGLDLWKREFETLGNFGVYYNESYVDDPLHPAYNQEHIPGTNTRGTNYIVTEDKIYVAQGISYQVLDIETGETIETVWMPGRGQCAYIGVSDDILFTGSNFAMFSTQIKQNLKNKEEVETFVDLIEANNTRTGGMYEFGLSASDELIASDRHDFSVKWKTKSTYGFIHNGITANEKAVFVMDKLPAAMLSLLERRGIELEGDFSITALDKETGDTLWINTKDVFGSWLSYSKEYDVILQATRPSRDMVKGEEGERMIVHRASDGTVIWDRPIEYYNPPILHGKQIIVEDHAYDLLTGDMIDRTDPITGEKTAWNYTRTYGCNYIIGSEHMLSFRSGAAGFYDLKSQGGTGNLGGFKSGCTSNLIAANGVLNAPDYTRTCQCAYQNQTSLAFVHMPQLEYWTNNEFSWSGKPVLQLGVNLGAPGDRVAENNTLWLDYPSVGGNSPDVPVEIEFLTKDSTAIQYSKAISANTEQQKFGYSRTNSYFIDGEQNSFVAASAANGVKSVQIKLSEENMNGALYTVKLYFAEPESKTGKNRTFDVKIQGESKIEDLNILKEAGKINTVLTKTVEGIRVDQTLNIEFIPGNDKALPILNGIEIIQEG